MARPDIEAVIGADPRPFQGAMQRVMRDAAQAGKGVEGAFAKAPQLAAVGNAIRASFAAAGLSLGVVSAAVIKATQEIATFERAAGRAGLSLQAFQEVRLAAQATGVSGAQVDQGLEAFNRGIADAVAGEGRLRELFEANNVALRDRAGKQRETNDLLGEAAELVRNAATEADKISIVEALGLTREWIPLLEKGADALREAQREAREAGAVLDAEVVRQAEQFVKEWNAAWTSFTTYSFAAIGSTIKEIGKLIDQAREFIATFNRGAVQAPLIGMGSDGQIFTDAPSQPLEVAVGRPRSARPTIVPRSGGGGGGGGGGSASPSAFAREIATIQRRTELAKLEVETFGQSEEATRRARLELEALQRVQSDGVTATAAQREQISQNVGALVEFEAQVKRLKEAQDSVNEASRFFGQAAVAGLSDLAAGGKKRGRAMENLKKRLAEATLQAALLGDGPLKGVFGGLFGGSGGGGGIGGLFGLLGGLFGGARATGGPVRPGRAYTVGERGPEQVVFGASGFVGQSAPASGGVTFAPVIDARGADAGAVARIERVLAEQARNFGASVMAANRVAQVRGVRA